MGSHRQGGKTVPQDSKERQKYLPVKSNTARSQKTKCLFGTNIFPKRVENTKNGALICFVLVTHSCGGFVDFVFCFFNF